MNDVKVTFEATGVSNDVCYAQMELLGDPADIADCIAGAMMSDEQTAAVFYAAVALHAARCGALVHITMGRLYKMTTDFKKAQP